MDLRTSPFCLEDDGVAWVEKTLANLTLEEKVGQLFCLIALGCNQEEWDSVTKVMQPGGVMYRPVPLAQGVEFTNLLREKSPVPMLIAANLEKGGNGIIQTGTLLGSPLEVGATGEVDMAVKLGTICAREGAAIGANWAFAPIIDIDYNFRNPITNTRTFGSNPELVGAMGEAYVKTVQQNKIAASIKHFPGDGYDERDQHLLTSVNGMECEEWDATYGKVYKRCIDAGALTVMIGHIMQPAYSKKLNPALRDEEILPASLSPELMEGLLRQKLGFNGLIVTDATTMAGFTIPMPRSQSVPASIAAGADMFLFTKNMAEDYGYMMDGVKNGVITQERLNQAVTRILALKAALGLHRQAPPLSLQQAEAVVGNAEHLAWRKECADKAVTLVKEQKGVLPISVEKTPRVLFYPIESEQGVGYSVRAGVCDEFKEMLQQEGFLVDTFQPPVGMEGMMSSTSDVLQKYDLIIYVANMSTKSNQITVRIEWAQPMGANCPHYQSEIPTIFVSVENPYHLLDVPRVRTFINAYNSNKDVLQAVLDKLMGRSEFKGKNPVDPFCGRWDTRL